MSSVQVLKGSDPFKIAIVSNDTGDQAILARRKTTLEELLFHEFTHCLDSVENKTLDDINALQIAAWSNSKEYRTTIGGLSIGSSFFVDTICSFVFDLQQGKNPRFPYSTMNEYEFGMIKALFKAHLGSELQTYRTIIVP